MVLSTIGCHQAKDDTFHDASTPCLEISYCKSGFSNQRPNDASIEKVTSSLAEIVKPGLGESVSDMLYNYFVS